MDRSKTAIMCNVEDFGAKGDGKTDNTKYLQAAIDYCNKEGGGRVILSSGTYLSGTLELKSKVNLHLEEGTMLKGIPNLDSYPEIPNMLIRDGCNENPNEEKKGYSLLYAYRARDIRLSGMGTINVGGEWFQNKTKRPFLLRVIECSSVNVNDLTFLQSAAWCCHVQLSRDISIGKIIIRTSKIRNGDGLNIDSSSNVTIFGCDIKTADDALCFKTTTVTPCRNIRVTGCVLESNCSGVKIGSESVGDFIAIHVSQCTVRNCGVVALKVTAVDGGSVENVTFSDFTIENCTGPVFVATGKRNRRYLDQCGLKRRSRVRDIIFENMNITTKRYERVDRDTVMYDCGQGIVVSGRPRQIIKDIRFKNLRVAFWGGVKKYDRNLAEIPFLTDQYPECHKLGMLPSYGYFFQYADNVIIEHCTERLINPDVRPLRWEQSQ